MLEMLIIALTLTLPLKTIHIYILMPRTVNVGANRNAGGSVQLVQFDKPTYRMLWNLYGIIVQELKSNEVMRIGSQDSKY